MTESYSEGGEHNAQSAADAELARLPRELVHRLTEPFVRFLRIEAAAGAEAFRQGNLGIMDYYKMKNVQADTAMRDSIADTGDQPDTTPKR